MGKTPNLTPRPFFPWVGSKRRLIEAYRPHLPAPGSFERYFEPFLGSGAVYFEICRQNPDLLQAVLSDWNSELVNAWRHVQDDLEHLRPYLEEAERLHKLGPEYFDHMRRNQDEFKHPLARAMMFLYFCRTCYNSIYRVANKNGRFSAPIGRWSPTPRIFDLSALEAANLELNRTPTRIARADFGTTIQFARANDFVFLDPPYWPASETQKFTSYTQEGFKEEHQIALSEHFARVANQGTQLLLANSNTPLIRYLYRDFEQVEISCQRQVGAGNGSHYVARELLIKANIKEAA